MADLVMTDYLGMLERSRLFESPEKLQQRVERWRALESTSDPDDTQSLANWLIENGYITQWQSENIFAGKYKGFFLGKYKLLRSIGAGGMSSVYLAVHTLLEREVAIKVLPKSRVTSDSSYLERFLLEAQAVAALDHPNIVRAYDVDSEGNSIYYLVMEYIDGPDLLSLVKKEGPLDYFRAAKYIRQAALGLHHAHCAGLIHRDMKPANLLVDKEDGIHVLDLGLARFTDEKRASLTLTYDENVLGTADYLAPEQARNSHNVDARADIYGLGCTLYYLLVGHVPFPEGTLAQRIAAHQKRMPARIQDERHEVPDALAEICWKMMAKDPNDRQQTAEEVADDLTRFLLESGQKVEGFTGTLASLQRKKEEADEKKADEIQNEALKDLNSFMNIANLANVSAPSRDVDSPVFAFTNDSPQDSAAPALSQAKPQKNFPVDAAKKTFFSALERVKKMVESHKKAPADEKAEAKLASKSSYILKNPLAREKEPSKNSIPGFSFSSFNEITANVPDFPDFNRENHSEPLEKADLSPALADKPLAPGTTNHEETCPKKPLEDSHEPTVIKLNIASLKAVEPEPGNEEPRVMNEVLRNEANATKTGPNPLHQNDSDAGATRDAKEKNELDFLAALNISEKKHSDSTSGVPGNHAAETRDSEGANPLQNSPKTGGSSVRLEPGRSPEGGRRGSSVLKTKAANSPSASGGSSISTFSHHSALGSSVLKKGAGTGSTPGSSARSRKTAPSTSAAGQSRKNQFSKKKQEQLLYAYVTLGFFVVLLLIAILEMIF